MSRKSKQDWLEEGLVVLTLIGEAGLTIDRLTSRLGVTKGSFYHHFKNRQAFSDELLAYWEEKTTTEVITLCEVGQTPAEKSRLLKKLATGHQDDELETAIRAWSIRDPRVKKHRERVDEKRFEYIHRLTAEFVKDKRKARILARLRSAVHIAAPQMSPPVSRKEFEDLLAAIDKLEQTLS